MHVIFVSRFIFYKFLQKLSNLSEHQRLLKDMKDDTDFTNILQKSVDINKSLLSNSCREIRDLLMKNTNLFNHLKSIATKIDNITSVVAASIIAFAIVSLFEVQNFSFLVKDVFESNKAFIIFEI